MRPCITSIISQKRIIAVKEESQKLSVNVFSYRYVARARLGFLLVTPSILIMVIPAFLLDIAGSIYQQINFRAYEIPLVDRKRYIFLDRYALKHLNFMEKFFCVYCGYFNGVMQYVSEIAVRTEEFWCPIKHSRKVAVKHKRYGNYLEHEDTTDFYAKRKAIRLKMRSELETATESKRTDV